jgi:hypothetical protein
METDCLKKIVHHFNAKSIFWDVALDVPLLKNWKKKREKKASIIIPFGLFFPNHVRAKIIHQRCIIISTCSRSPSFNFYAITPLSHCIPVLVLGSFSCAKKSRNPFSSFL